MIIWSGWGVLTVLFAVIGIIVGCIAGAAAGALAGGVVGGGVAAVINHYVAKTLGAGKVMIDPATQQQVLIKKSNSLFFIPMAWFTPILAVGGILIGIAGMMAQMNDRKLDKEFPGKAVFAEADGLIDTGSGTPITGGNTPAAEEAAASFSKTIKAMQSIAFVGESEKYASKAFLTYCHQGKGGVTFICHVPGIGKYKDAEAKDALAEIAWLAAKVTAKEMPDLDPQSKLTVGLRGFAVYSSIQQGTLDAESPSVSDDDMKILYVAFDPADAVAE